MDFETARRVLLVASAEEVDGEAVSPEVRRQATDSAPDPGEGGGDDEFTEGEERFLAERANAVLDKIADHELVRESGAAKALPHLRTVAMVLLVVALSIGFFSKNLGPSGVISILVFPLLAVMLWSLLVYSVIGVRRLFGKGEREDEMPALLRKACQKASMPVFVERWVRLAGPVYRRKWSAHFHLCAAVLAIGAVAAMYWQGLVRDYQATWESTFLSPDQVRGVLSVALAPATWVPGLGLPDAAGIEAIRAPESEGAAAWIHRYAVAAAVVVIVPRLVLALLAALRARRLGKTLPVRAAMPVYFKTLLAEKRGVKSVVRVVPHRIDLEPAQRDALRARLHAHWGGSLWMEFLEPVAYGDEDEFAARAAELGGSDHIAVVCGLNATPEDESQGRLLRAVKAAAGVGDVLLALDEGDFEERFGEGRTGERRGAWEKLAGGCGITMLKENS